MQMYSFLYIYIYMHLYVCVLKRNTVHQTELDHEHITYINHFLSGDKRQRVRVLVCVSERERESLCVCMCVKRGDSKIKCT